MKKCYSIPLVIITIVVFGFLFSCSTEDNRDLPQEVKNMLTPDQQQSLEEKGMTVNEGVNPPNIVGVYYNNTNYCTYDSTGWYTNTYFDEYYWRFYDQSGNQIKLDYTAETEPDTATGVGAFITGDGELFSVFLKVSGSSYGVSYTAVTVVSGRKIAGGIQDFMDGFIMTSKNTAADPDDEILAPVNTIRIFVESDGIAETSSWPAALSTQSDS